MHGKRLEGADDQDIAVALDERCGNRPIKARCAGETRIVATRRHQGAHLCRAGRTGRVDKAPIRLQGGRVGPDAGVGIARHGSGIAGVDSAVRQQARDAVVRLGSDEMEIPARDNLAIGLQRETVGDAGCAAAVVDGGH